ncbi:proteasome ATPase [Trueperella pyogenes]|uniref:AAA ATPase forming ring-shaped complexes n=2 Tax=Trueperella pyogenes TaxID=1661 RepID=A0A3S9QPB8_9ACTO|nr:proteasome ATPase [Trueperella pyogenes]AWG04996.1 proteasome ATPase [Trueperella pyogenes]AWG17256.1 proteasome ATPase [Trueperella pyogenes]AZR05710.1 proteasome ATPase [Trueperella pyogenes]AZR07787.1 proteasome ATPase [Trueperella pyogenes]MCI7689151.1 proteasome ATPase [Trueperella pyogenes]
MASLEEKNGRLADALQKSRRRIQELSEQVENLSQPPGSTATFLGANLERHEVIAIVNGRKMILAASRLVELGKIRPGQELLLNEALVVVGVTSYERTGEIVTVKLVIDASRVLVQVHADDERVLRLAGRLQDQGVQVGDTVLADLKSGFVLEHVERPDVEHLLLEEIPDVSYADIGGLDAQIVQIKDSVELPFEQPELYREHGLKPPKGVLLYGPPGTGKTLIARAVATSLADKISRRDGYEKARSYFLNIKGPQLLDKYVGETERQIREIFSRARDRAASGIPVVIFFDEMEALFRTRGSGISSDVETTVVPQLLAEIDGVEQLDNVIVIGASNREDMIDPAILRPGRLDIKIRIERPNQHGAWDIMLKYLTADLPIHADEIARYGNADAAVRAMARITVEKLFTRDEASEFIEVSYADGSKEVLYISDFVSGAMLAAIVGRAKKLAIKDLLAAGERGIRTEHMLAALAEEMRENEDLTQMTNPDEWARIHGRGSGKRVTYVRPLVASKADRELPEEKVGKQVGERPVNSWDDVVREGLI